MVVYCHQPIFSADIPSSPTQGGICSTGALASAPTSTNYIVACLIANTKSAASVPYYMQANVQYPGEHLEFAANGVAARVGRFSKAPCWPTLGCCTHTVVLIMVCLRASILQFACSTQTCTPPATITPD